ncbi:hypothetical protein [Natronomonas sp. EA1]|uniref:hypothetical protein n=1 Tax=Natronomonas sp. EA1 TaxID=3421655 RepID=UPI003EB7C85F
MVFFTLKLIKLVFRIILWPFRVTIRLLKRLAGMDTGGVSVGAAATGGATATEASYDTSAGGSSYQHYFIRTYQVQGFILVGLGLLAIVGSSALGGIAFLLLGGLLLALASRLDEPSLLAQKAGMVTAILMSLLLSPFGFAALYFGYKANGGRLWPTPQSMVTTTLADDSAASAGMASTTGATTDETASTGSTSTAETTATAGSTSTAETPT